MRINRLWLLLFIGVLVYSYQVYAGCCVIFSGNNNCESSPSDSACTASGINNSYFTESCAEIRSTQCNPGCCCLTAGLSAEGRIGNNLTCKIAGGNFTSSITDKDICDAHCSGTYVIPKYNLYGWVRNSTGFVPNATVTLTNRGSVADLTSSDFVSGSVGYYSFSDIESGPVAIKAQKDQCSRIGNITLSQNTELNITLDCCSYNCVLGNCVGGFQTKSCQAVNPALCDIDTYSEQVACGYNLCKWNCTGWNPPLNVTCPPGTTQRTQSCPNLIVAGGCQGSEPKPNLTMACAAPASQCGNGIINLGEECDFNQTTKLGKSQCVFDKTFNGCNQDCTCKNNIDVPECIATPDYPKSITPYHVPMALAINLSWNIPTTCSNYITSYVIHGCENSSGCHFNSIATIPNKNTNKFLLTDTPGFQLKQNIEYCFKLETKFNSSISPGNYESNISCIILGDDICLNPHPPTWCGTWESEDAVLECNATNNVNKNKQCTANQFCGLNELGKPGCIQLTACEKCNGLFGIFGYQGLKIADNGTSIQCPTLQDKRSTIVSSGDFSGCYLDYSKSTVDKTYSCGNTNSCYDYKSRDSCVNDYCDAFRNGTQNICEWKEYSPVFNKGVCRPKKEYVYNNMAVQNCSLCNNPNYNRIYGNCTADTCGLYGVCYYQSGKCLDGFDITCDKYNNEKDCIGGVNISVNALWINVTNQFLRAGVRTNNRLALSNDTFDLGVCQWNGTKCFRNADNLPDSVGIQGKDCGTGLSSENKILCEQDNEAPVTTITTKKYYSDTIDLTDHFTVSDNNWPLGDTLSDSGSVNKRVHTWLYYCKTVNYCNNQPYNIACTDYNILNTTSLNPENNNKIFITKFTNNHGCKYTIYYYAEDAAKNLEVVKNFNFTLDLLRPNIDLITEMQSFQIAEEWFTDFRVKIILNNETSLPVKCYFNLTPHNIADTWQTKRQFDIPTVINNVPLSNNIIISSPGQLSTTYIKLPADGYEYELYCTDDAGNAHKENGTYYIQGDMRINTPSPSGYPTFRSSTLPDNISIQTTALGKCRYSMDTSEYALMTKEYQKSLLDNYSHYALMSSVFPQLNQYNSNNAVQDPEALPELKNSPNRDIVDSGIYRIYTACNLTLNNQKMIITGDNADIINFAVDNLAPITKLMYDPSNGLNGNAGTLSNFTNNESRSVLYLYLQSSDDVPVLKDINNLSRSFGVSKIYYCVKNETGSCPSWYEYGTSPIIFNYEDPDSPYFRLYENNPEFCYYGTDNGGNKEATKCITLKLRNTNFGEPDIEIIPVE